MPCGPQVVPRTLLSGRRPLSLSLSPTRFLADPRRIAVAAAYASVVALDSDEWAAYQDRVAPTEDEWDEFVRQTAVGHVVRGVVVSHHRFGFFLDIGWGTRCLGLVEIPYVRDPGERVDPSGYPAVGSVVERAIVLSHTPHNHQARLTIRPSDLANAEQ
jgi:ribosomal protein S1